MTGRDGCLDLPIAADVAGDGDGARADFTGNLGYRIAIARHERDIGPGGGENPRSGGADSLAGAGDQNAFTLHVYGLPFLCLRAT